MDEENEEKIKTIAEIIEEMGAGEGMFLLRGRPYMGQEHTDSGERGKTEVKGITFRDLSDCFLRACCLSAGACDSTEGDRLYEEALKGEMGDICENDIFKLPWDNMNPIAIKQNLSCEVERIMGIFPNILKLNKKEG